MRERGARRGVTGWRADHQARCVFRNLRSRSSIGGEEGSVHELRCGGWVGAGVAERGDEMEGGSWRRQDVGGGLPGCGWGRWGQGRGGGHRTVGVGGCGLET